MGTFSNDGYARERLDEFLQEIIDGFKTIFGENIDVSADSIDGQIIGILAEAFSDLDQNVELISKTCNPAEAAGNQLSTLVTINGIARKDATYSTVSIDITGVNGTIIPAGSIIKTSDEAANRFIIDSDITISGTTGSGTATAENAGAVIALTGTLTVIDTPKLGWQTVTNPTDASLGQEEESDAELRVRRKQSVSISARNTIESIAAELINLDGVTEVKVLENVTDTTDDNGIRPHGTLSIVDGGDDTEIRQAIWDNKTGGSPTDGSDIGNIVDSQGITQEIRFSRPTDVDIYIDVTIIKNSSYPADGDTQIKQSIVDYFESDVDNKLGIGDDVEHTEIYAPIYQIQGFKVNGLRSGKTPDPTGQVDIPIAFNEFARFDTGRINIIEA
jgi:uncharacterized phage protein gp47/JayE